MPVNLLDYNAAQMTDWFASLGEKPFRARQVLRWLHGKGAGDVSQMTDLANSLRQKLSALACIEAPPIVAETPSDDGTRKFLFDLGAGNAVESVFIPEDGRGTLCISTQAGCTLDCAFCATGKQGFARNLTSGEIIAQLWQVKHALHDWSASQADEAAGEGKNPRQISNVVLMGMGEPLLNFEHTVTALDLMLDDHAYGLSRRRVTVSTAGVVPAIDELRERCPVALAVSLHAPDDALRDRLVPLNRKYPLRSLLAACQRYLDKAPRDFITFAYTLIAGVNDSPSHARTLLRLTAEVPCKFNLIAFNPFVGSDFSAPSRDAMRRFAEILQEGGRVATMRRTRGDDVAAACGQLAGQVKDRTQRSIKIARAGRSTGAAKVANANGVATD